MRQSNLCRRLSVLKITRVGGPSRIRHSCGQGVNFNGWNPNLISVVQGRWRQNGKFSHVIFISIAMRPGWNMKITWKVDDCDSGSDPNGGLEDVSCRIHGMSSLELSGLTTHDWCIDVVWLELYFDNHEANWPIFASLFVQIDKFCFSWRHHGKRVNCWYFHVCWCDFGSE